MTTSDVFPIALGRAVTCERIERGMKRKNLVAASQISPAYLAAIENGDRTPSYTILNRLAAAMGMSVSGIIARALEIANDPRNGLIPDGAP